MTFEAGRKIRTMIVDDEDLARQVLREFLSAHPGNRNRRRMRERL